MPHSNISIFIPHMGCPHMCSFCNQNSISGEKQIPHADDVKRTCEQAFEQVKDRKNCEVAFFGGSFTAIDRDYMLELLNAVQPFLGENGFYGIRISTRPDFINNEILALLKDYGVTAIELGAQSMSDKVLLANDRGHTAEDVINASMLIKSFGFELGLQMMVGLYKSSRKDEIETFRKIYNLKPDTVRIYPVAVIRGTKLAKLYESGEYKLFDFDEVVELCAEFLTRFEQAGVRVIRCGLHSSELVEQDAIAGFYHPAFRELCEGRIFRDILQKEIDRKKDKTKRLSFAVNPNCLSKAVGHKRCNIQFFQGKGIKLNISVDSSLEKFVCKSKDEDLW